MTVTLSPDIYKFMLGLSFIVNSVRFHSNLTTANHRYAFMDTGW